MEFFIKITTLNEILLVRVVLDFVPTGACLGTLKTFRQSEKKVVNGTVIFYCSSRTNFKQLGLFEISFTFILYPHLSLLDFYFLFERFVYFLLTIPSKILTLNLKVL